MVERYLNYKKKEDYMSYFDEVRNFSRWADASKKARELVRQDKQRFLAYLRHTLSMEGILHLDPERFRSDMLKIRGYIRDDIVLYNDIINMSGWFYDRVMIFLRQSRDNEERREIEGFVNEILNPYRTHILPIINQLLSNSSQQHTLFRDNDVLDLKVLSGFFRLYSVEIALQERLAANTNVIFRRLTGKARNILKAIKRKALHFLSALNRVEEKHPLLVGATLLALILVPMVGEIALSSAIAADGALMMGAREARLFSRTAKLAEQGVHYLETGIHSTKAFAEGVHIVDGVRIAAEPFYVNVPLVVH
jgi:hypothetical protein